MIKFLKKPIVLISTIIIIIVAIVYSVYLFGDDSSLYNFVEAERGELVQEVSVTGKVEPSEKVNLSFEKTGKVKSINVDVGQEVEESQSLITLENSDLIAQLSESQANLEVQEVKLEELKRGTREEEIGVARTKVLNAEKALVAVQGNLEEIESKAQADIDEDYDDALTSAIDSITLAENALYFIGDMQLSYFNTGDEDSNRITEKKANAVLALLGAENGGGLTNDYLVTLSGGAKGAAENAQINETQENIDTVLTETKIALQKIKTALDSVPLSKLSSTQSTNLATHKSNANTELTVVSGKQQAIAVQKATNEKNISTAQSDLTTAENALVLAQAELVLKQAGATSEEISSQEAQVKKAQAAVSNIQAQISKTILRSPINGVVSQQDVKVGEIVAANKTIVSVISKAQFKIEANVSEVDIAKVKIGDSCRITLDAYGEEVLFSAKVITVDPAETVIEGVSTYKVTLEFTEEDERIRSGMTANIDILTARLENVITVPQRAVISRNGEKIVRVLRNGEVEEKEVTTGIRGSAGNIEIIEGIEQGDNVIIFIEGE